MSDIYDHTADARISVWTHKKLLSTIDRYKVGLELISVQESAETAREIALDTLKEPT